MKITSKISLACVALLFSSVLLAQTKSSGGKSAPTGDLTGVWYPSSVNKFNFIWTDSQGQVLKTLPVTSWGAERSKGNHPIGGEYTALTSNDPNFSCLPPGVPNVYTHAYPVEILQVPGRTIFHFEYDHLVREIFTDGREHAKDANPTWMGDSVGHWEGDTLVADSTGFNDKTWLDVSGHPHSESLHVVERFRRVDHNTLMIDITIDDPQAYTAPLKTQRKYILKPGWNIMEYICEDNRVSFLDFEKKVGAKGAKAAEVSDQPAASQSIAGDWKGTILLADGRSLPATASFSAASTGSIAVADPSVSIQYQLQNVKMSSTGTITAITPDQTNFLGKISADGKQITGDIILPSGTGHKISLTRP
ncbi:MAG TPA: hypothetical protein VGT24_06635 [Candidatus Acidoferrales bacterium]|nr:hypothetical protein [Candidatus Acidoferrales bacterium]